MNRFVFFPLVLGMVGALAPSLTALEILVSISGTLIGPLWLWRNVSEAFNATALYGLGVGVLMGIGAAFWESVRALNRSRHPLKLEGQFLLNLWWCGVYTLIIALLNAALLWFVMKQQAGNLNASLPLGIVARVLPVLTIMVVNFVGVVWATVRTIATDDVLSPSILMSKLRRSTAIMN